MSWPRAFFCSLTKFACVAAMLIVSHAAYAGNNGGGGIQPAGVEIDASGVLRIKLFSDPSGALRAERIDAARKSLNEDIMRPSELRKISLNRLEAALAKRLANGETETPEMRYLAGLTQITHVFYFPETKDIVIAGPAEGFYENINGRVLGLDTSVATLQLQDLVAALRAYSPMGDQANVIGCSIDPTQEGLQRMQAFLKAAQAEFNGGNGDAIAAGLKDNLGLQTVSVRGVSPKTHFAQVLIEADYRMKLIGIGLESNTVGITSYISKAKPSMVAKNGMQRWFFVPDYDRLRVSEDNLAMELVGQSTKLVGETESVTDEGKRVRTKAESNRASEQFCRSFTEKYDALAKSTAVYAELRNLMDMSIVAAFIQHQGYYEKAGWNMEVFGDEKKYSIETLETPKQVETAVNAVWKGNSLMTPIGGGVSIHARESLSSENMKYETNSKAKAIQGQLDLSKLGNDQWWWD
jgi:Protein of unknown function (DUF1598)